ncbi:hypothetical protein WA158_004020 [Blastocystis sp. Blastoise]
MESFKHLIKGRNEFSSSAFQIFLLATAIKLLLIPSYRSTDFEVHRNWLAITHNLPHEKWYFEDTSIWTLDYPPFFAWFEYFISLFAQKFDPSILTIQSTPLETQNTILFQRLSVIVADLVFYLGVYMYCCTWPKTTTVEISSSTYKKEIVFSFCILCPALFMVDHIHFQYNGFLMGIYLISISLIRQNRDLLSAVVFSCLLNFKHIFMYQAPVYFCYLLLHYCYVSKDIEDPQLFEDEIPDTRRPSEIERTMYVQESKRIFSVKRFLALASVVIITFFISFYPFLMPSSQPRSLLTLTTNLKQLYSRLFPFKRGLIHTYWAPNIWALYTFLDNILTFICSLFCKYTGTFCSVPHTFVGTSGVTGDIVYNILPNIPSWLTFLLTLLFIFPCLIPIFMHPHPRLFVNSLITCSFVSFLFGWHVHEKALLTILIPITIICCDTASDARLFIVFSTITNFALFPLLFKPQEQITALLFTVIYYYSARLTLDDFHKNAQKARRIVQEGVKLSLFDYIILNSILGLYLYNTFIHPLLFGNRYPFIPLMLTSVLCSVGVIYCFFLSLISSYKKHDVVHSYLDTPVSTDTSEMESEG